MTKTNSFCSSIGRTEKSIFPFQTFFLISSFIILLFFPSCSNHQKNDEEKGREKMVENKVKKISEYTISVFAGVDQQEYLSSETFFDDKGCVTKEIKYAPDGSTASTTTCEYDSEGNRTVTKGNIADSSAFKETRSYDKNNNRIELYHYLSDKTYKYRNTASYDDQGRMIVLDWYWPTGLVEKRKFTYDFNNKIKEDVYSPTGELFYYWEYKYDKNDNLIEEVQKNAKNVVQRKTSYSYDNNNLLANKALYYGDALQNSQTYEYTKSGLLSKKANFNPFGKTYAKYRYEYEFFK